MRIKELADSISIGKAVSNTSLTIIPAGYLYIQPANVERGIAISESGARYLTEKTFKSFNPKPHLLEYGDFLIFRLKNTPSYSVLRFTQDLGKGVIPSENFIIVKNPQSFLSTFLQHETGKLYLLNEIEDINIRSNGDFVEISKQFKLIDIDPIVLDNLNIPNYIPPGNTKIGSEDLKKINVRADIITIDNINKRLKENEIRLDGYFQRKSNLWSDDVKSRLIETIILNMPIPPLFFDVTNDDKWLIVDGLQRVSAIKSFYSNELALINLDYIPELEGKRFIDLDRQYQRKFEEKQLSYFAIYPGTPKSVRYKIFKNINVSALILNRQEIRHAINEDEDADFTSSRYVIELTQVINRFLSIPEKGASGKERMADSELCLRYVAFRVLNFNFEYNGSIQDFLDKAMEKIYWVERNKLNVYKDDLALTLETLLSIFPAETIFTKAMVQLEGPKNFNGNLFGVWTSLVSRLAAEDRQVLVNKRREVRAEAEKLGQDPAYEKAIDGRYFETIESLKTQIELTDKFLKRFLND